MSARLELEKVIARHESQVGASQKLPNEWVMSQMELSAARRAAVLILFGGAGQKTLQPDSGVEDLDLLFVERAATLRKHAGQVAFPGGGIDQEDSSVADAALREAWEETGVQTSGIEVLGNLGETELPVSNFLVTPVLGWWHTESEVYPADPAESAGVFRAPVAHLWCTGRTRSSNPRPLHSKTGSSGVSPPSCWSVCSTNWVGPGRGATGANCAWPDIAYLASA